LKGGNALTGRLDVARLATHRKRIEVDQRLRWIGTDQGCDRVEIAIAGQPPRQQCGKLIKSDLSRLGLKGQLTVELDPKRLL
jgi:hypothetical protein